MENKKATRKKVLLITGIVAGAVGVIALTLFFLLGATLKEVPKDAIAHNVYVGAVDVSGMTKKEAEAALKEEVKQYKKDIVKLKADEEIQKVSLGELGFKIKNMDEAVDEAFEYGKKGFILKRYKEIKALEETALKIELEYTVDKADIKDVVTKKITTLENQAENATITRSGGKFVITDGKRGKKVEVDKAVKVIKEYVEKEWKQNDKATLELPTILDEPDITREDLEKVTSVLGTFTTTFGALDNRGKNIANATKRINGALLMPGDVFSASKAMEPFTVANGYYSGGAFQDGQVIQTIGGGVCQVSTTLYNAVILAELEVVERAPHSMTVAYVPVSQDAAIASGYKDLKFKNNQESPIYVEGYISGGKVTFTIYGEETRPAGRKVKFVSEEISRTKGKLNIVATSAEVGYIKQALDPHDAVKSRLWKVVTENGKEVSRTVFNNSSYRSGTGRLEVGIGTDNAEAKKIIQDAIATQDEAKVREAVAKALALITPANPPENPGEGTETETTTNTTSPTANEETVVQP